MSNKNLVQRKNILKNGSWTHEGRFKEKPCAICGKVFKPFSGVHKYCSKECKGREQYLSGRVTTATQYQTISGNWKRYFSRLCCRSRKRATLSVEELLECLEKQDSLCALSGIELTCKLEKGTRHASNASIDRIEAGGPYVKDNIQLVCSALNGFRSNTSVDEFIWWCKKVTEFQNGKNT